MRVGFSLHVSMGSALFDGGKMGSARFLLSIVIILDGSKMGSTRFGWSHIFPSRIEFCFGVISNVPLLQGMASMGSDRMMHL